MITYLLDCHNFDINEVDSKKSSAVHWAIFNANEIALSFLLARGPEINIQDVKGITPLHLAVISSEQEKTTSLIRMLLMRGANPFTCDQKGRTPLEYGKEKISDEKWLATVVTLLEDAMDLNKTLFKRIKGAFTLEQPVHKIRRSRKTMVGFISTMLVCQLLLEALVFPHLLTNRWLKTAICAILGTWALFGLIF